MQLITELVDWTKDTFTPLGAWGLFILAFIESSFFPIPPDILLVVLCLEEPGLSLFFAFVATLGSVLGGIAGYGIGYFGEEKVLTRLMRKEKLERAHRFFERYGPAGVLIAAFSPIPYKVFTISAGLFYISFKKFILSSIIGRACRFFLVAVLVMLYGEDILVFIENYFNVLTIIAVILFLGAYIIYRRRRQPGRRASGKGQKP